jgi:hypothetical protein
MQLFATLGLYLILAFVLPGFCYLLVFGLCFPNAFSEIRRWLPPEGKDAAQGFWVFSLALTGGLLLSSVTFAFELGFRRYFDFFALWYPEIDFKAPHEPTGYTTVLVPSAFMHFNIGLGIFIIFVVYLIYVTQQGEWTSPAASGMEREKFAYYLTRPRI